MLKFKVFSITLILLSLLFTVSVHSEELTTWPREVKVSSGSITIYQPQVESLAKNILKGKAAIAYHGQENAAPVFGVVWFDSRVAIDREENTIAYETLTITDTRFPKENKLVAEEFSRAVDQGMKTWNLTSSLDELTTALAAVEQEQKHAENLKNDPPVIVYKDKPALLVTIDGKAVLQKINISGYQAVGNTPFPLFFNEKDKTWYLSVAKNVWYQAKDVDGPWRFDSQPPTDLALMVANKAIESGNESKESTTPVTAENAPTIVVVHKPTELVVSDGKANFTPITDDLLAMTNTDSQVFMDVKSQHYFLVISGRWYKATSMEGKWNYVASDKLPATFADIPQDSKYGDVRAYVAGTDEAKEAVMDAQIPQTAAVKRGTVDIELTYDGKPEFKKIAGTNLQFAVNCSETVLKEEQQYYLVKDAVWYISESANGPWTVSDHAPPGIDNVPPSSPVYHTKYVYVYDSTPEVVYVGYTPGYAGSYIYGPTIVYGTGWYYRPWITPYYYYPRPWTWGYNVSYNPWRGWGFGLSWSSGPFHSGFYTGGGYHGRHWGGHRCWGPRGYRPSFNQETINRSHIKNNRYRGDNYSRHNNLYRNSGQRSTIHNTINSGTISSSDRRDIQNRMSDNQQWQTQHRTGVNRQNLPNNVLADQKGNVLRNNNGQWQKQSQGQWKNSPAPRTSDAAPSSIQQRSGYNRPSPVDRQQYSRQRATERTQSYSRPSGGGHLGGGDSYRPPRSGGGGGRR
ncbi:MAG: hypothetical protein K9K37_10070 [Desulfocapsa sp.]|nr:hypothetical protein [Desulfocapsa sp.]